VQWNISASDVYRKRLIRFLFLNAILLASI
jgi:hypothetical protein